MLHKLAPLARVIIEETAVIVALALFIGTLALWMQILAGKL